MVDSDDRLMGKISLSDYDGSSVTLSYWLHPDARGRGWMTIATDAVTATAHDANGLAVAEVRASVAAANHASRRVLERSGFRLLPSTTDYNMGDGSLVAGLRYLHRHRPMPLVARSP